MQRVGFEIRIRPDRLDDYLERHRAVWPEMLAALRDAGWRNYTLFSRGDGVVFAYLECDDFEESRRRIAATAVAARWEAEMTPFFAPGTVVGDERLTPYFHLD